MEGMFKDASAFNQDLSHWVLRADVIFTGIFDGSGIKTDNLCALKAKGGQWLGIAAVAKAVCN